ncbi:hypothetical protein DPMN_118154 [Dreissena polymorpha]|uniref:Uncharacterized protein n=1 Tax=Dreissena polymorpha TaxID=45954 RepID=A0A9D4JLE6_DREPO|nr:hypothetical protein DPMN_118154 [Dreissena polymorpha]
MSSARDVKQGCSVSVLYTGHLKEPGTPLELNKIKSNSIQSTNYKQKIINGNNYNNNNNNGGDNNGYYENDGYVSVGDDYDAGGNDDDDKNTRGGKPLPHLPPSPHRCSITIVEGKIRIPPFQNPGYGPGTITYSQTDGQTHRAQTKSPLR